MHRIRAIVHTIRMTQKKLHSFLLLELMIALFLLTLCLIPLLRTSFFYTQRQKTDFRGLQLHKLGEEILLLTEAEIRSHTLSWEKLLQSQEEPIQLPLPAQLSTPLLPNIQIALFFSLQSLKEDKERNESGKLKLSVTFHKNKQKKVLHAASSTLFVYKNSAPLPLTPVTPL